MRDVKLKAVRLLPNFTNSLLAFVAASVLLINFTVLPQLLHVQAQATILTLALPKDMLQGVNRNLVKEFETANPTIQLNFIDIPNIPEATAGLPAYFDAMQNYANSADVLFVSSTMLSPQATQAGYYLDLTPLINVDPSINKDDFYPSMWSAFQWDHGFWAAPIGGEVRVLNYDPAAFDKAGLAYPSEKWTIDDFAKAVDQLTVKDASGHVITPGFGEDGGGQYLLMMVRSLIGESLLDTSTDPAKPALDKPSIEAVLPTWERLDQAGELGGNPSTSPLSVTGPRTTFSGVPRANMLLPGGKAGLDVFGLAVSAGTQNANAAYAFVKYMSTLSDLATTFNLLPPRKSIPNNHPADVKAIVDQALANALTPADLLYMDYLPIALTAMKSQNMDAKSALQAAETRAVADQQTSIAQKSKVAVKIIPPTPVPTLAAGKISLNFDIVTFLSTVNNSISKVAQDFAASDPQVGSINVVQSHDGFDKIADSSDCFYLGYNAVQSASLDKVISLDSFMTADPAFDKSDFIGNVLTAVQRDNKTWAMPLQIEPMVLQYNTDRFAKAGLTMPAGGWTVNNFIDSLKALKSDPTGQTPFVARGDLTSGADGTQLLILIADYGGIPLDYRTNPTTINFTDPATVTAIQQVLDLAKNGLMTYNPLGQSPDPETRFAQPDHTAAIYPDGLTAISLQKDSSTTYKPVLYPKGTKYTGFGYILDTAYISAQAKAPEACYRWLSALAKHPEVFAGMPARHSVIAGLKGIANPDLLSLYDNADALLKDPNTIPIATLNPFSTSISDLLTQYWLYQAFDSYVLNNADLPSALKDAEGYAKTFQGCIANLPVLSLGDQFADKESTNAYVRCAEKADARLKPILDPLIR